MEGLVIELTDLSRRNDELMIAKDADVTVIRDLDAQLKEYKRKYEQAKTELRSVKGQSSLLLCDMHISSVRSDVAALLASTKDRRPTAGVTRWRLSRHPRYRLCVCYRRPSDCWPLECANTRPDVDEGSDQCRHGDP